MADEAGQNTDSSEQESTEGSEGNKKKLIIIAVLLILIVGAGAGLFASGILGGGNDKEAEQSEEHKEEQDKKSKKDSHNGEDKYAKDGYEDDGGASFFLPIPTMVVNLNSEDGVARYLRLTVHLELASAAKAPAVEAVMPRVIDQFQTYLRELRVKDLRGSAGIYRLQMELLWRVNKAAQPVEIKNVLFQEILIQ